jgi:hypothetical protein
MIDQSGKIDGVERQDCMPVKLTEVNLTAMINPMTKIDEKYFFGPLMNN